MKKSEKRQRSMRMILIAGSSFMLLAAGGLVDGYITHRWSGSNALQQATAAMGSFPATIGDWESESLEIPEQVLTVAGATGYAKRIYRNQKTGEWIVVTLLCGEHGPISLHPPTVCFTGNGWQATQQEEVARYSPRDGVTAAAWQATFRKAENYEQQEIVADWSWTDGSGWKASANPRYEFAGSPYLFKLYVISDVELTASDSIARRDQFVRSLLSELDRTVFNDLSTENKQDGSVKQ